MRRIVWALSVLILTGTSHGQFLFTGLETSPAIATTTTDLTGFPNVAYQNHFALDVSGAAAAPDGTLYMCNGAFTTKLYRSINLGPPQLLATLDTDMHALAYGRGELYGYSNFASPKGIYQINVTTGECTLVLDVYTGPGFRFFALDYNPVDDLFYGYTEYGDTGLYSINVDTGDMIKVVNPIPASNSSGRGLAVGNNTVYLTATRGDDGIPHFSYDLSQGVGGDWLPFTNPYPNYHSTGGAAWIPGPCPADINGDNTVGFDDLLAILGAWGPCPGCPEDIDTDGNVGFTDLLEILGTWGPCS